MVSFNREVFFDSVRGPLFSGRMNQQQVDGMNFKLDVWEALATSMHETAAQM